MMFVQNFSKDRILVCSLQGSFKARSAPHTLLSDVPDLSSEDTASEHRADDDRAAEAEQIHGTEMESSQVKGSKDTIIKGVST